MVDLRGLLSANGESSTRGCGCRADREDGALVVDAADCAADGALAASPPCRSAVVASLEGGVADAIHRRVAGSEWTYAGAGAELFGSAGRFAVAVESQEPRLAERARRDPLGAAREATGRAGPVADLATDAGLARFAGWSDYGAVCSPLVGPTISAWRVDPGLARDGRLAERLDLDTGGIARIYDRPSQSTRLYHLVPAEHRFDGQATRALARAHEALASEEFGGGDRAVERAVRTVSDGGIPTATVARVLRKHVQECGYLRDLFADAAISDAYVTAPAGRNCVRVRRDGETLDTNVAVTADGVAALASRFRRESGRGFSRANPTLDAATTVGDRQVRVAGVTEPVSDGQGFAFRAHDRAAWTLPALVANDTLTSGAAGLLSVAVERGAATLLAGPRGSGKTTALGALLWEIPAPARTVIIEDAPELPVEALQAAGRDVQALRADGDGPLAPVAALRAALRLGDGALVVGEVRGEEAGVLYEAMRVGANSEAVLGTIHGDGADEVLERVVADLGVAPSAFAATDLVVTLEIAGAGEGRTRRVATVEEVVDAEPVGFEALFERTESGLDPTGRIDRGNSRLVAALARPEEAYGAVRSAVSDRAGTMSDLAVSGRTDAGAVSTAQTRRNR